MLIILNFSVYLAAPALTFYNSFIKSTQNQHFFSLGILIYDSNYVILDYVTSMVLEIMSLVVLTTSIRKFFLNFANYNCNDLSIIIVLKMLVKANDIYWYSRSKQLDHMMSLLQRAFR